MLVPKNATRLKIGKLLGYVPESWNDLPKDKLMKIVAIITLAKLEEMTADEMVVYLRLNILAVLMNTDLDLLLQEFGFTASMQLAIEGEAEEEKFLLNQVMDTITFCFEAADEENPDQLHIKMGLTRCPYPQLTTHQGITVYAPADELKNLTIYELASVLTLMDAYNNNKDADVLHQLLGTIYRPGKLVTPEQTASGFDGDRRQRLYRADHLVAARARQWKKVPHIVKQTLWFWLAGCRQAIVDNPAFAILFERSSGGKEDPFGWAGTLLHIADNKVMNMDQAANAPYSSALLQLAREKMMALEDRA
jgi:hypothetical protein